MTASERDRLLVEMNTKLDTTVSETQKTRIVVTGNGGRGHEQRIEDIEGWMNTHPRDCPHLLNGKQIMARRAVEMAVIGLIIAGTQLIGKAFGWW